MKSAVNTHSMLYRHCCVHSVRKVQIDVINTEALETAFTAFASIFRQAIDQQPAVLETSNAELACYLHFFSWQMLQSLQFSDRVKSLQ